MAQKSMCFNYVGTVTVGRTYYRILPFGGMTKSEPVNIIKNAD